MRKNTFLIVVAILAVLFAGQVFANITFLIDVHEIKEKQTPDKKISKEENDSQLSLEIGDSFFSYTKDNMKFIYDFSAKRIYTIDLSNKMFSDTSLFSVIGFRTYEFQNRQELGSILGTAGIDKNPMLPVLNEHLFSLQEKDKISELSKTTENKSVIFSAKEKELLSYSKQGEQVSRENKEMFIKFFRYVYGGHPQILEQLSSNNIIPKSINICRYIALCETSYLTISRIESTPAKSFSLNDYSLGVLEHDSDPFLKILYERIYSKPVNFESYLTNLQSDAKNQFEEGNYLDTMLAYFEYNLASSLGLPPAFEEQKAAIFKNEDVKILAASLTPKSKEEAEKCLSNLQQLEKKAKTRQEIIKIFEADTYMGLHNYKEAKELFHEILLARPYIAGVYKDLGDLYYNEYDAVMAWRCWDAARKIAPNHKMLVQINEFEAKFFKDHPEFF